MRTKRIFAVIKNIGKTRDPGNEVVLFNMNFPKEFMDLILYRQSVAWGTTFFYNSFAMLIKLLPCRQNLVAHILKVKWTPHMWLASMLKWSIFLKGHNLLTTICRWKRPFYILGSSSYPLVTFTSTSLRYERWRRM